MKTEQPKAWEDWLADFALQAVRQSLQGNSDGLKKVLSGAASVIQEKIRTVEAEAEERGKKEIVLKCENSIRNTRKLLDEQDKESRLSALNQVLEIVRGKKKEEEFARKLKAGDREKGRYRWCFNQALQEVEQEIKKLLG